MISCVNKHPPVPHGIPPPKRPVCVPKWKPPSPPKKAFIGPPKRKPPLPPGKPKGKRPSVSPPSPPLSLEIAEEDSYVKYVRKIEERGLKEIPSVLVTPENKHLYENFDRLFDLVIKERKYLDKEPISGSWGSDPNKVYGIDETGFVPTKEEMDAILSWGARIYGTFKINGGEVTVQKM